MIQGLGDAANIMGQLPTLLADFRAEHGFSQQQLASEIGMHRNTLSSFEVGQRDISYKRAGTILRWMADVERANAS